MVQLKAGDLVGFAADGFQKIHRRFVKGGGQKIQPQTLTLRFDDGLPFPGGVGFFIQVVEVGAVPHAAFVAEILVVAVQGDGVRRVGLDLQAVGAGVRRRPYDLQRTVQAAAMVGAHLGDKIHAAGGDFLLQFHGRSSLCSSWYLNSAISQSERVSMSCTSSSGSS